MVRDALAPVLLPTISEDEGGLLNGTTLHIIQVDRLMCESWSFMTHEASMQ